MRRILVLLATMATAVLVASGVAYALNEIDCDGPGDTDPDPLECRGTLKSDEIDGTQDPQGEEIRGLAGKDLVDGFDGDDTVYGGPNGDGGPAGLPFSEFGDLNLEGAEDSDTVYGQGGRDNIDAAQNDSPTNVEETFDRSYGGAANDRIYSVDGNEDLVNCGSGEDDVARIDDQGIDTATNCETVQRRTAGI
jgi:Ca2+-binding RTX toxin-like protein